MPSRRNMCSKASRTVVVPAPDDPVTTTMGNLRDMILALPRGGGAGQPPKVARQPGKSASASRGKETKAAGKLGMILGVGRQIDARAGARRPPPADRARPRRRPVDMAEDAAAAGLNHVGMPQVGENPGKRKAFMPPETIGVVAIIPRQSWREAGPSGGVAVTCGRSRGRRRRLPSCRSPLCRHAGRRRRANRRHFRQDQGGVAALRLGARSPPRARRGDSAGTGRGELRRSSHRRRPGDVAVDQEGGRGRRSRRKSPGSPRRGRRSPPGRRG
jgi:hypothetical protein